MTTGKYISHTILSVIMLLTGNACSRFEVETASPAGRDIPISFSASIDENRSKGIFTPENFSRPGHEIAVLDILDDGTFHIGGVNDGREVTPATYTSQDPSSPYWSDGKTYYWIQGVHNFFAYATYYEPDPDNNRDKENKISNIRFEKDGQGSYSLILEDYAMSVKEQFDFIYARHRRDMADPNPYRDVELEFKHLFAAVGFTFSYISSADTKLTVADWYFTGLKNQGTATIPLTEGTQDAIIPNLTSAMDEYGRNRQFTEVDSKGYIQKESINIGESFNPYFERQKVGSSEYILIWPQTFTDLSGVEFHFRYAYKGLDGNWTEEKLDSDKDIIEHTLKMGGDDCDFDINRWEAGTKYMYNITISDNKIYWDVNIVPWITDDVILDER